MNCARHNIPVIVHQSEDKLSYTATCDLCEAEGFEPHLTFDCEIKPPPNKPSVDSQQELQMKQIPTNRQEYIIANILLSRKKGTDAAYTPEWVAKEAYELSKEYDIISQRANKEDLELAEFVRVNLTDNISKLRSQEPKLTEPTMLETGKLSDGHHTFDELYEHRHMLFLTLCNWLTNSTCSQGFLNDFVAWCSKLHSDGTMFEGQFIMGIFSEKGNQITYHLPIRLWEEAVRCTSEVLEKAPEWDGHTSNDVLKRLKEML